MSHSASRVRKLSRNSRTLAETNLQCDKVFVLEAIGLNSYWHWCSVTVVRFLFLNEWVRMYVYERK